MAERTGPTLAIVGSCRDCPHLRTGVRDPRLGARLNSACVHPTRNDGGLIFAKSSKAPTMPDDCPELGPARLALARAIVGAADDVLCSKCGKPVMTADEKSYRMHSMAGCPR